MNKSSVWNTSYLPEIDGLRAFSIIFVITYHAFPDLLKSGYIGVDIFFVISGFLITNYIIKNLEKGQFGPIEFFGRRIRRLFPTLIIVMASSVVFGWFVLLDGEYKQLGNHIASSSAFFVNFILASESGYFDNLAETKPMLHLWSLAVEEQFYILWPIILCIAWKYQFNIPRIFIIFFIVSFYLHIQFIDSYPAEVFFWPLTRFWELASGGILAWVMAKRNQTPTGCIKLIGNYFNECCIANIMSLLGFSLIIYGATSSNPKLLSPLPLITHPIDPTRMSPIVNMMLTRFFLWLNRTGSSINLYVDQAKRNDAINAKIRVCIGGFPLSMICKKERIGQCHKYRG